jgi:hypothetical protein
MQIALVAVVLLAGMWFTVLKPKSADSTSSAPVAQTTTQSSEPVAPGVKGLTSAIDKAKGAAATSDAANAKIQAATGGTASTAAPAATATATATKRTTVTRKAATTTAASRKSGTKAATAKAVAARPATTKATATATTRTATATRTAAAKPAAPVDPSARLLAYLKQGKTLVVLFYGRGADDKAARKAVHQTALTDPKHVVSAYVPISKVGSYEAITTDVNVLAAPTILVIASNGRATPLTGYVDAEVVRNAVAAARTAAATPSAK